MLEQLFKFPIVMVDGDNEERKNQEKERLGTLPSESEEDYDVIFGVAEYPYWDVIGMEDRWLPTRDSLDKALNKKFDACIVRFANVGQLLVPWSRKKFKDELQEFAKKYETLFPPKEEKVLKIKTLSIDDYEKLTNGEK